MVNKKIFISWLRDSKTKLTHGDPLHNKGLVLERVLITVNSKSITILLVFSIQDEQKSPKPASSEAQITQIEAGRYVIFKKKTPGQPRIKVRLLKSDYNDSKELIDQLLEKL